MPIFQRRQKITIIDMGLSGPTIPGGKFIELTQAEYNALAVKDPDTLYVIKT